MSQDVSKCLMIRLMRHFFYFITFSILLNMLNCNNYLILKSWHCVCYTRNTETARYNATVGDRTKNFGQQYLIRYCTTPEDAKSSDDLGEKVVWNFAGE